MNDDFLTRFRQSPRPESAAGLYQRISKPMSPFSHPIHSTARRLAFAGAAVLAAAFFAGAAVFAGAAFLAGAAFFAVAMLILSIT